MKSELFKLAKNDYFKGCAMAVISAILTGVYQVIQNNGAFDLVTVKTMAMAGFGAGISYLIKNVFTNSEDEFLKKEK